MTPAPSVAIDQGTSLGSERGQQLVKVHPEGQPWPAIIQLVLDALTSPESRRAYRKALERFLGWYHADPRGPFTKATVQQYRSMLQQAGYAPSTINLQLSAVRKLAIEAADNGLMDQHIAAGISRVRGCRTCGTRIGNWLAENEAVRLLQAPDANTLRGRRDRALLGVSIGCGLRREELSCLNIEHIQMRDGRQVIVDLRSKHGRVRSVPIPEWVGTAIGCWTAAAGITSGRVFRAIDKADRVCSDRMGAQAIYEAVRGYGYEIGTVIAPHDLRRTFAKLAHEGQAPIEQIQLSLGHASISTTERYLGVRQNLRRAPGDYIHLPGITGALAGEIQKA